MTCGTLHVAVSVTVANLYLQETVKRNTLIDCKHDIVAAKLTSSISNWLVANERTEQRMTMTLLLQLLRRF
jgi:hypothetical protein